MLFSYLYENDSSFNYELFTNEVLWTETKGFYTTSTFWDQWMAKNDLHGLSAIAKHCLHAHLKKTTKKQAKCLHVFTHGLLVHTYRNWLNDHLEGRQESQHIINCLCYLSSR